MIFLAAGVAHHRGFFKDEGLDADIVVMTAPASIAALSNGDIDYTLLTGSVIRAAIRGLPSENRRRANEQFRPRFPRPSRNQNHQRAFR